MIEYLNLAILRVCALFGMLSKRDPFKGCKRDLQRSGIKFGHDLNYPVVVFFVEVPLFFFMESLSKKKAVQFT